MIIGSDNLCLSTEMFMPLTFNEITHKVGFKPTILLHALFSPLPSLLDFVAWINLVYFRIPFYPHSYIRRISSFACFYNACV